MSEAKKRKVHTPKFKAKVDVRCRTIVRVDPRRLALFIGLA
jgi:hypothetical protein